MEPLAQSTPREGCPGQGTLADFSLGKLAAADLEAVADHLSSCAQCGAILHNLQHQEAVADHVVDQLKQCLERPPLAEDSACRRMAAEAEAIGSPTTQWSTDPQVERPDAAEALLGQLIGRYVVLAKIGGGGMGVVYRARQLPIDRPVALKVILAGVHASAQVLARFDIEGKAVARLRHPNVVQIHEFGNHEGLPYYSMELVEGGSLEAKLAEGPLEPHQAAELVHTLATTVEYAHQKQVLHRDLKPANVLLTPDGVPKIADFGLAKLLDVEEGGQTQTDMILGTPSYMAPEQAEGLSKAIGPSADVYALGAILYAALTGHPPFLGQTKAKTLDMVRRAELVPPSRQRPGVPSALEAICLKCLAKSPARRYASAQALADDLGRWLRGEPTIARPPGRTVRFVRGLRRHAIAATVAVLLIGSLGIFFWRDPDRVRRRAERDLDQGRPVQVIPETGPPLFDFRVRLGDEGTKVVTAPDGTFTVHTWSLCLLELFADPRHERYRFRVKVRHEKSDRSGEVGVYFAHRVFPGPTRDNHLFARMTYNDIRSVVPVARPRPGLHESMVRLGMWIDGQVAVGQRWNVGENWTGGAPFQPHGEEGGGAWRELEVVVTPEGVWGTWDGQPVGDLPAARVTAVFTRHLSNALGRNPGDPFLLQIDPTFTPRGGLGLLLWRGSASFCSAVVTPLVDED
jgi:serine/threonine-protein kinase